MRKNLPKLKLTVSAVFRCGLALLIATGPIVPSAAQAKSKDTHSEFKEFSKSVSGQIMKLSAFLSYLESQNVPKKDLQGIALRAKDVLNEEIYFESLSKTRLVLRNRGQELIFAVKNVSEGEYILNNHKVSLRFEEAFEENWQRVLRSLPRRSSDTASIWFRLFFPEAQASTGTSLALGAAVIGAALWMSSSSTCKTYETYATQCSQYKAGTVAYKATSLYANIKAFEDRFLKISLGCSSAKSAVKSCIAYLEKKIAGTGTVTVTSGISVNSYSGSQ